MSRPGVLEAFDKPSDRLIQMPHMKGYVTRVMESGVSVSAWVIFLYYFQPIFTVVVWLLTGRWVYLHIFSTAAIEVTLDMMFTSAVFALFMMGLFWCWAKWNLYYYGALDRRKLRPPITNEEVADFFGVNEATVARVQQAKFALLDPVADQLIITVQQELS
jgi:poly-beta-1,6-N-acetyl-D-glucosamine biosynthesis protein PgaD